MREYQVKPIRALGRGFEVLAALERMRAASLHDLHLATGIPKATLTRILLTAGEYGLVWQRLADGAFMPSQVASDRNTEDPSAWLVELASPVMEELVTNVQWPSVIAVPRLTFMEVMETNSSKAYFDDIPYGKTRYQANYLRASTGRAYLAFCPDAEREAILRRLRERNSLADTLAFDEAGVAAMVAATRRRGFATRARDFGGDIERTRAEFDDGRDSIALPIMRGQDVLATMNLTWRRTVVSQAQVLERYLTQFQAAVRDIEVRARNFTASSGALSG